MKCISEKTEEITEKIANEFLNKIWKCLSKQSEFVPKYCKNSDKSGVTFGDETYRVELVTILILRKLNQKERNFEIR